MNNSKKILILSANPRDTAKLRLDEEVREIEEGLRRSRNRSRFEIRTRWAVTLRDLRRAMLDEEPEIIHFCGHGDIDGIMLEDSQGNAVLANLEALAGLFKLFPHIESVILNACYSQEQAEIIAEYVPYVIGMPKGISDKTAIEFAVGYYDAMGAGKPPDVSFEFGCNAIQLLNMPESLTPVFKTKEKKADPVRSRVDAMPYRESSIQNKTGWEAQSVKRKVDDTQSETGMPSSAEITTLRDILSEEDTVLFIGSGISMWSGLPSWAVMIDELAHFLESIGVNSDLVRTEANRGDLLLAASYGFDLLTKHQIGEFIRSTCRYGKARPHEIHRRIVTLGPRCFVTTNYDNLIEESLRIWQPDRFYRPPVTNRHLTETAEIIHTRAIDFIFKPHGDAGDSESIILTREQYRTLLPQGERQAALESLKMLLASRPVVYLGYGLHDPDFIYIRDLLANTYKGGIRDHYAIMADVSSAERDYWRRNVTVQVQDFGERRGSTLDR